MVSVYLRFRLTVNPKILYLLFRILHATEIIQFHATKMLQCITDFVSTRNNFAGTFHT